jgi:hypothetical protein
LRSHERHFGQVPFLLLVPSWISSPFFPFAGVASVQVFPVSIAI